MLTRPAGHGAKAEARKSEAKNLRKRPRPKNFSRQRPRPQCIRPRPDTLENNSVCIAVV